MKEFKIFEYPEGSNEAVKQGWSWPGFFFGPIWAMAKKMRKGMLLFSGLFPRMHSTIQANLNFITILWLSYGS